MVDRCVCEDKTFAELLAVAKREGLDYRSSFSSSAAIVSAYSP